MGRNVKKGSTIFLLMLTFSGHKNKETDQVSAWQGCHCICSPALSYL